MEEDIEHLNKNNTWEVVKALSNKKFIGYKWTYKIKYNFDGEIRNLFKRLELIIKKLLFQ